MSQIRIEFENIRSKYPGKIPIILQFSKEIAYSSKRKLLVDYDFTVSELMMFIRSKLHIPSNKAIFLYVDDTLIYGNQRLYDVWNNRNRFMIIKVALENCFG